MNSCEKFINEDYYLKLNKDDPIIKTLLSEQKGTEYEFRNNYYYFSESIKDYESLLKTISNYLKEFKLENNSILLSILIEKLINKGYFSKNGEFKFDSSSFSYDIAYYNGIDIIEGKGCCRHVSGFSSNLFKQMNIQNDIISCFYKKGCTLNEAFKNQSNHAVNLINYDGKIYVYDIAYGSLSHFTDELVITQIAKDNNPYQMFYKPYRDITIYKLSFEEMHERLKRIKENINKPHISYDEYLDFRLFINDLLTNNSILLDDLKNEANKRANVLSLKLKKAYEELVNDYYS